MQRAREPHFTAALLLRALGSGASPQGVSNRSNQSPLPELFETPDASTLLFLPLAHVFGRMIQVACVMRRGS